MPSRPEKKAETENFLLFQVGRQRYAVPAAEVEEIVTAQPAVRVPGAPPYVLGIVNLRGRVVPLVDLHPLLRCAPEEGAQRADAVVIVLEHEGVTAGLLADKALDVVPLCPGELHERPGGAGRVATVDGAPVLLPDLSALLAR